MPFAGYKDFGACEKAAKKKGVRSPGAYCGAIKRRTEGSKAAKKTIPKTKSINGKTYKLRQGFKQSKNARKLAEKARRGGFNARVVKRRSPGKRMTNHLVYIRKRGR